LVHTYLFRINEILNVVTMKTVFYNVTTRIEDYFSTLKMEAVCSPKTLVSNKLHAITSQKTLTFTYQFTCTLKKRSVGFRVLKHITVDANSRLQAGRTGIGSQQGQEIFLFSTAS
jgi:hypothetical protein